MYATLIRLWSQGGWGDRDRIRADRRLDRGCCDRCVPTGRNQPYDDLSTTQRRSFDNRRNFLGLTPRLGPPPRRRASVPEEPATTGGLEMFATLITLWKNEDGQLRSNMA